MWEECSLCTTLATFVDGGTNNGNIHLKKMAQDFVKQFTFCSRYYHASCYFFYYYFYFSIKKQASLQKGCPQDFGVARTDSVKVKSSIWKTENLKKILHV